MCPSMCGCPCVFGAGGLIEGLAQAEQALYTELYPSP